MFMIFDFDGTLVDSFGMAVKQFNILADEFQFRKISPDDVNQLRNLNSKEIIKFLNIPFYKIPSVIIAARKRMKTEMTKLMPIEDIPDVLAKIKNNNVSLGIITTNSKENVTTWLEINNLKHHFDFIHSVSHFFGKDHALKKAIQKYNINKEEIYYVGDETRDIDAANQNGIHAIAVTWGVNSELILQIHKPHFIAKAPADLIQILKPPPNHPL